MDAPVPGIAPWVAFNQFQSIRKDVVDNAESVKTKLTMPVLAIGGEKSFGANEAVVMRNAATNHQGRRGLRRRQIDRRAPPSSIRC